MRHLSMVPRLAFLVLSALMLSGCAVDLGKDARFGMYGGKQPEAKPKPAFDVQSTLFDARWFPAYVRWAPDDSHLLVSLCHVNRTSYCRIGKYWLAGARWELLDLQPQVTYRWPSYSPDGERIVASAGGCDKNYDCPYDSYALVLLSPDGKRTTKLADTFAEKPTFSDNGKKIIYWRLYGGGGADVALFDLVTGREQMLTKLVFDSSSVHGGAFFLPGGERFVFAGWLPTLYGSTVSAKDGKLVMTYFLDDEGRTATAHPFAGTKLDPKGPNYGVIRYVADARQGLVTRKNVTQVDLLWPDNGISANNAGPEDVSRTGEVLYYCSTDRCLRRKLKSGQYRVKGLVGDKPPSSGQRVLMLRAAREEAPDTAAFVVNAEPSQIAAVSNDGLRVAFSEANPLGWHRTRRFGIATLGNPNPEFIDWPRLDLDPAATQRVITQ